MMTDPIADMLSRLRNASLARLDKAEMPASKLKERVADILKQEGYIADYRLEENGPQKKLVVVMKYSRERSAAIAGLRRVSRPGRRMYVSHNDIPVVQNGLGIAILSTSHGVMTDKSARDARIGGELMCEVW